MSEITRIGIYGGTFAPIHNGHKNAAKAFMDQMQLHYLFVIPTSMSPEKIRDSGDDARHRMKMCELAFEGEVGVIISDMEIERGGTSYTVDTLRYLKKIYPNDELVFLCGSDMFLSMETWREPQSIMKMATIAVAARKRRLLLKLFITKWKYQRKYGARCKILPIKPLLMSSTQLRLDMMEEAVEPAVYDYIQEHNLYGETNAV